MNQKVTNFFNILHLIFATPFVCIVPFLPRCFIVSISRFLGRLTCLFSKRDYKVSMANLNLVYGDTKNDIEKRKIILSSFSTFILTVLDMAWFSFRTKQRMKKYVVNPEALEPLLTNRGAVTVTGHIGNWELLAKQGAFYCQQLITIAAPSKNPYIDKLICKLRASDKLVMIPKQGALKRLLKSLRSNDTIAIAADQNTLPMNGGVYVNFLGLPAPITRAPFLLAEKTSSPIFVGYCIPTEKYKYKIYLSEPYLISDDNSEENIINCVVKELEDAINSYPEYWLWMYKKWKYIPKSIDEKRYPFYAKRHNRERFFAPKDNM
ncbi:MAG: lysophospholipid acyltransferase family protein [Kiritimatiellae bacterium]|jgi:KDO2-lipid IV(A) lauroyltransferase|nr:lysophospholipid acyltransferase family protein [Kiritimatiellia bacterium]